MFKWERFHLLQIILAFWTRRIVASNRLQVLHKTKYHACKTLSRRYDHFAKRKLWFRMKAWSSCWSSLQSSPSKWLDIRIWLRLWMVRSTCVNLGNDPETETLRFVVWNYPKNFSILTKIHFVFRFLPFYYTKWAFYTALICQDEVSLSCQNETRFLVAIWRRTLHHVLTLVCFLHYK